MHLFSILFCVFFFKQKTAYEMRISDWSSDVCSSDLVSQADRQIRAIVALAVVGSLNGRNTQARPEGGFQSRRGSENAGVTMIVCSTARSASSSASSSRPSSVDDRRARELDVAAIASAMLTPASPKTTRTFTPYWSGSIARAHAIEASAPAIGIASAKYRPPHSIPPPCSY